MSTHTTRDVTPSPHRDHADADVQRVDPAQIEVHEAEPVPGEPARYGWWRARTAREEFGVGALGC